MANIHLFHVIGIYILRKSVQKIKKKSKRRLILTSKKPSTVAVQIDQVFHLLPLLAR